MLCSKLTLKKKQQINMKRRIGIEFELHVTDEQAVTAGCHGKVGCVIMSKIYLVVCGWKGSAVVNTTASQREGLHLISIHHTAEQPHCTRVNNVLPVHSTATAQSSHPDHRL